MSSYPPLTPQTERRSTDIVMMRGEIRSTVERLDRPSAYYLSRVRQAGTHIWNDSLTSPQNKRRRDRDDTGDDTAEPATDPLANATTLYVGNLYARPPTPVIPPSRLHVLT